MRYGILCGVAVAALGGAYGLAGAQPAARGETWTRVAADNEGEYYYDAASVRRAGGMVRSRLRVVVLPARPGAMRSAIIGAEINCTEQTIAYSSFEVFGENGQLLRSSPNEPPEVERLRPDSPEERLYRHLCPPALLRPLPPPPPLPTLSVTPPPMRHPVPVAPPAPPPPPPPPIDPSEPVVRARPLAPLASIITADDYPAAALRAEAEGRVRVRLQISRRGRVTGCAVLASSGYSVLDAATCRIFTERARFVPARNARGRSVADTATAGVYWRIPDDLPPPPEEPAQPPQEQS